MSTSSAIGRSSSRPYRIAWVSAWAGWLFDYYEISIVSFIAVPVAAEFHLSAGQTSTFFSLQLLGIAVGGILFGYLGDRFGRQRILTITIAVYGVLTLARAFAPNYDTLLWLTFAAAVGLGGEYGVGQALVSEMAPKEHRGFWSAMLYNGGIVGLAVAAVVGGYVLPHIGWRWTFAISCLPVLLAFFIRKAAPESNEWSERVKSTVSMSSTLKSVSTRRFLVPLVLCTVAGAIEFFAYYGISAFLPTYLIKKEGMSFSGASWWIIVEAAAIFVGVSIGAYTSDRWGRRITWTYLSATAAIGGLVLGIFWNAAGHTALIFIPYFVLYLGTGVAGVFGSLFSEQFATANRSVGVSTSLQVARGLSYFPPLIAARIYPNHGYQILIFGGAALYAILACLSWMFKETKGKDIAAIDADSGAGAPAQDRVVLS